MSYAFPQDKPVMRFLDTRGLGEADYDPADDLKEIGQAGNALVVVMKADEPEQSAVHAALKQIKKQKKIKHLLLVHTAVLSSSETDRTRQIQFNSNQVEKVWGKSFESVAVDFETDDSSNNSGSIYNYDVLLEKLTNILPVIGMMVVDKEHSTQEEANFDQVENEVLWYAGSAAASDLIPGLAWYRYLLSKRKCSIVWRTNMVSNGTRECLASW